jgi:hypothetical protein
MSTSKLGKAITQSLQDDFPTLTPLTESIMSTKSNTSSSSSFISSIQNTSWQTWIIIILILALLGINIFAYLAKGTQATASIFDKIFAPILKLFGYTALEATNQTIQTTATGTNAAVNTVASATNTAIKNVEQQVSSNSTNTNTNINTNTNTITNTIPKGQLATTSQPGIPVQKEMQQNGGNIEQWQQDSLQKALNDASRSANVQPDDSQSSIQASTSTGKSGWCYIGEDRGIRTCAEIGVNDVCMSGDVFPSQAICMNPNLRA